MLRISGDGLGYLATENEYENYSLRAEWKWGSTNTHWGDRLGKARDSGIFVHASGPDGNSHDGQGAFMAAIECNLFQGAVGDILLIRGTDADGSLIEPRISVNVAPTRDPDGWPTWMSSGSPVTLTRWGRVNWFNKSPQWRDVFDFRSDREIERRPGEWNETLCILGKGRLRVILNGTVVNEVRVLSPTRGRILLQCEGSEIWFRRVELRETDEFPEATE